VAAVKFVIPADVNYRHSKRFVCPGDSSAFGVDIARQDDQINVILRRGKIFEFEVEI
jgi:hypothetical protein